MRKWQIALPDQVEFRLKELATDLRRLKAAGWSVVFSRNEIIVRPKDRALGKFTITPVGKAQVVVSFFSRELNIWNKHKYFDNEASLAVKVSEWIGSEITGPLKQVR
jgi:hypothetical protein